MKKYSPWLKVLHFFWLTLWTLIGLLLAVGGWTRFVRFDRTWWAFHFIAKPGGIYMWVFNTFKGADGKPRFGGFTFGAVMVFREDWLSYDPGLVAHETTHVIQGLKFGLLHPIVYVVCGLLAMSRGGSFYIDNVLEVEARANQSAVEKELSDAVVLKN